MANADDTTVTLPRRYIQLIDRAFNRAVTESETETAATREGKRPHKRRSNGTRNSNIQTSSGEYIFDEQESNGGFIPEDGDKHRGFGEITHIPLSAIPRALQLLDLPPDDAEVLNVFANAASGWRVPTDQDDDRPGSHEAVVSRRDWHAVCAVILPAVPGQHRDSEDEQSQSDSPSSHNASDSSDLDGTSEEDYLPRETAHRSRSSLTGGSRTKGFPRGKKAHNSFDSNVNNLRPLTARQEREALFAFALFFPDITKDEQGGYDLEALANKRVTIKDVAKASASIREKLSAEEIMEMLTFFSSSQSDSDLSLSLTDFQQMMIATRLT